ncbi:MAG: nitroreductase family protein [Acidobacteriaceae bacterium]
MSTDYPFSPLVFDRLPAPEQHTRSEAFRKVMLARRTVRDFAPDPVPFSLIENAIAVAANAPSGANKQPWHFVVVTDPAVKRSIREGAEAEEREFYEHRCPPEWLADLAPLGTDWRKEFLETAPYLIAVFRKDYDLWLDAAGAEHRHKNYYVQESVGIAVGMLLCALHVAGLASLTHTPSPMGFLGQLLQRPKNERPFVLIPTGFPAEDATVPDIHKKPFEQICTRV